MQGTASPGTGSYLGVHSPRLKAARRLNKRAFRQRERAFLAEGPQAVAEAFHCGAQVIDLFVTVFYFHYASTTYAMQVHRRATLAERTRPMHRSVHDLAVGCR